MSKAHPGKIFRALLAAVMALLPITSAAAPPVLEEHFRSPPVEVRPWTYWFIMDGNLTREGITADFEAIRAAGLGGVVIMEVAVGIRRGPVKFMSDEWRALLAHAVHEAERLGLRITLNAGPGWTGSGGPWVKPEQSMQHLVASETNVVGPLRFSAVLPQPPPRRPFLARARCRRIRSRRGRSLIGTNSCSRFRRRRATSESPTWTKRRCTCAPRTRRSPG